MFQIDNATAASVKPASTPPGVAGYFTDGNPAVGQAATIVPAEWLNAVMLEVMNAVTGSGQALSKSDFSQLWTAIQTLAKNPGVTPPQFDSSTNTATTAFVQRALGNISKFTSVTTTTLALTAAQVGQAFYFSPASPGTVSLPSVASVTPGSVFFIAAFSQAVTVTANGTDNLDPRTGVVSSIVLTPGEDVLLVAENNGRTWFCLSGSYVTRTSTAIAGNSQYGLRNGNGYQKFASGVMLQWQSVTANGAGQIGAVFPVSFPTTYYASFGVYLNATIAPQPGAISVAEVASSAGPGSANYIVSGSGAGIASANVRLFIIGS